MVVEENLKDYVSAMFGLAIEVLSDIRNPTKVGFAQVLTQVQSIDRLGRTLEYRGSILHELPELLPETQDLKREISAARAAAEQVANALRDIKKKSTVQVSAIVQSIIPITSSMVEMLKRAHQIVEDEPWFKLKHMDKRYGTYKTDADDIDPTTSLVLYEQFFRGSGIYKKLPLQTRNTMWQEQSFFSLCWPVVLLLQYGPSLGSGIVRTYNIRVHRGYGIPYTFLNSNKMQEKYLDLSHVDLSGVEFDKSSLPRLNCTLARMNGTHFLHSELNLCIFLNAQLQGTTWLETQITRGDFRRANLSGSRFSNVFFESGRFGDGSWGQNFSYVSFKGATFTNIFIEQWSLFYGVNMEDTRWENACVGFNHDASTQLSNSHRDETERVYLKGFDGKGGKFRDQRAIRLMKNHFQSASFTRAVFSNCLFGILDFTGSLFVNATFTSCCFVECTFQKAQFKGAAFYVVDFSSSDLSGGNFTGAKYDRNTKWPAGFDPVKAGAILI